jgi:hypothetical protein
LVLTYADYTCRVRVLKDEAHSQKAAEAAVGLTTDNGRAQKNAGAGEVMSDD